MRFAFSQDRYQAVRKRWYFLGIAIPFAVGVTAYPVFGLAAGLACVFFLRRSLARLRASWLEITTNEMQFGSGKDLERVPFSEVSKVLYLRTPQGALCGMKVFAGPRMFALSDFEHLYEIETALQSLAERSENRVHKDLGSHAVWWVATLIAPLFVFFLVNPATAKHAALFWGLGVQLICVALGIHLIWRAPLSSARGSRYRKAEWALGLLLALTNGTQSVLLADWSRTVAAFDTCSEAPDRPAFQECFRRQIASPIEQP